MGGSSSSAVSDILSTNLDKMDKAVQLLSHLTAASPAHCEEVATTPLVLDAIVQQCLTYRGVAVSVVEVQRCAAVIIRNVVGYDHAGRMCSSHVIALVGLGFIEQLQRGTWRVDTTEDLMCTSV